jgi:hypothetical protein
MEKRDSMWGEKLPRSLDADEVEALTSFDPPACLDSFI